MKKKVNINENTIKTVVSEAIKRIIKENDYNDIKVDNVFFKLCEITDEVGFTAEDWAKLVEKCKRQQMMRSF